MMKLFDHFGVTVEDSDERSYVLLPEHLFSADAFPGLPEEGLSVTFSRELALAREDLTFLTVDHPLVTSAIESLLATDHGNAAFFRLEKCGEQLLMVEVVSVLESVAPVSLHAERFLPSTPIREISDQKGRSQTERFPIEKIRADGRPGPSSFLREKGKALRATVPKILQHAQNNAEDHADLVREKSVAAMHAEYDRELERLLSLREMGHPIREEEIESTKTDREQLEKFLKAAPLRVDSVRLILGTS